MEEGFIKGSSDNLPQVDFDMIDDFYSTLPTNVEARHGKMQRSGRASYGDNAIGYVQLKRDGGLCTVKAKITPEHRVRNKNYSVVAVINEANETIQQCECVSCAASSDHCKHAVAFIFWLHRRSEEPAVTSETCYWRVSRLSQVGRNAKYDLASLVQKTVPPIKEKGNAFLYSLVKDCESAEGGVFDICRPPTFEAVNVYQVALQFSHDEDIQNKSSELFTNFLADKMKTGDLCKRIEILTREQSDCPLWYQMRFGRITASKIHQASRCQTLDGSLMESILGASSFKPTEAIKRGSELEKYVLKEVAKVRNLRIKKSGLILTEKHPVFGASPDGVTDEFVIEVKCPIKEKTVKNYVNNNVVAKKYEAQVQLQMFFAQKQKGLFCVADPDFETTKNVSIYEIQFNENFCKDLLKDAYAFWEKAIFPALVT